jgi:hypothetical protein
VKNVGNTDLEVSLKLSLHNRASRRRFLRGINTATTTGLITVCGFHLKLLFPRMLTL